MIDTIILRIYDTAKYRNLIHNLDKLEVKGYQTETASIEKGKIAELRNDGYKNNKEVIDILKMNRTGEFLIKSKVVKQMNASNHYSFAYFINYTANFIEFNFSIPKYIFGSNVLQFVDHYGDPAYTYHEAVGTEFNIKRSYELLQRFLNTFFKTELLFSKVNLYDVEVHRIDVCFSQVFPSKQDALKYLEYQKRLKKKYSRDDEGGTYREYDSSLMYITKRYSAKIYHKGSEYLKNDLKEHRKINKERGHQYFKTDQYQALADRILRYELTLRTDMLNYLHKRRLFRKNCSFFQMYYKEYQRVENVKQKNDRIAKKLATIPDEEKEAYKKVHPYERITKDSKGVHKYVTKLITQRTFFTLAVGEGEKLYNKQTVNYDCKAALFSKGLLRLCHEKLMQFVDDFQIKELPDEERVRSLIRFYNIEHRKPLPTDEMVWFYQKLKEIGSFKETVKILGLSRASKFRYRDRFKKIGITENCLIPLTDEGMPKAKVDFSAYHYEMTYNPHFLRPNTLFNI